MNKQTTLTVQSYSTHPFPPVRVAKQVSTKSDPLPASHGTDPQYTAFHAAFFSPASPAPPTLAFERKEDIVRRVCALLFLDSVRDSLRANPPPEAVACFGRVPPFPPASVCTFIALAKQVEMEVAFPFGV